MSNKVINLADLKRPIKEEPSEFEAIMAKNKKIQQRLAEERKKEIAKEARRIKNRKKDGK